jgi:hypothetical protein
MYLGYHVTCHLSPSGVAALLINAKKWRLGQWHWQW